MPPPLNAELEPIAFLLGTWEGDGAGAFPTVEDFTYRERTRFFHDGRPFLYYEQDTWRGNPEQPSHTERGFLRTSADGRVEAAITQTARVVEVAIGQARDGRLELETASMSRTPTAKDIRGLWRVYEVDGDVMHCTVDMEAMGVPTFHLRSTLIVTRPPAGGPVEASSGTARRGD